MPFQPAACLDELSLLFLAVPGRRPLAKANVHEEAFRCGARIARRHRAGRGGNGISWRRQLLRVAHTAVSI